MFVFLIQINVPVVLNPGAGSDHLSGFGWQIRRAREAQRPGAKGVGLP